jgi:hypothetical protein
MKKFLLGLAVVTLLCSPAGATVILDDFVVAQGPINVPPAVAPISNTVGIRTISLFSVTPCGLLTCASIEVGGGFLNFSSKPTVVATGGVTWVSPLSLPLLSSFVLRVADVDVPGGSVVFFASNGATTYASAPQGMAVVTFPSFNDLIFPLASFGGLDPTAITDYGFVILGSPSLDVLFDHIGYNEIPEPGTMALLGTGLVCLALLRRK